MKKYLFYYSCNGTIGVREHHFDWKENDVIYSNGVKSTVICVFDGNQHNIRVANDIMKKLKKYEQVKTKLTFKNGAPAIIESRWEWKNSNAKLDFVKQCIRAFI